MRRLVDTCGQDLVAFSKETMSSVTDSDTYSIAHADLLRRLVRANEAAQTVGKEEGPSLMKRALTESELLGNIFVRYIKTRSFYSH